MVRRGGLEPPPAFLRGIRFLAYVSAVSRMGKSIRPPGSAGTPLHTLAFLIELVISTPVAIAAARPSFTPIEAATETAKVALSPKLIQQYSMRQPWISFIYFKLASLFR